jgi:hypothetical protein
MIRVVREARSDSRGFYRWYASVDGEAVEGRSREPLLDACRTLKSLGVNLREKAGLFREGNPDWDLRCSVGWGAAHTVDEAHHGFHKWKKFPRPDLV